MRLAIALLAATLIAPAPRRRDGRRGTPGHGRPAPRAVLAARRAAARRAVPGDAATRARLPAEPRPRPAAPHVPRQRGPADGRQALRGLGRAEGRAARPQPRPLPDGVRAGLGGDRRRAAERARSRSRRSCGRCSSRSQNAAHAPVTCRRSPRSSSTGSRPGRASGLRTTRSTRSWRAFSTCTACSATRPHSRRRRAWPPGWACARRGSSDAQWQEMLQTEFGGMQESLTDLYAVTRDPEHLRLARLFDHSVVFDPLARGEDALDGLHANTQIPKAIGAERDCELTGDAALLPRGGDLLEPGGARALLRDRRPQRGRALLPRRALLAAPRRVDGRDLQHLQHAQAVARPVPARRPAVAHRLLRARALQPHPGLERPGRPGSSPTTCR